MNKIEKKIKKDIMREGSRKLPRPPQENTLQIHIELHEKRGC